MRWIVRTFAVLTVVSWIVIAGLFARPVDSSRPVTRGAPLFHRGMQPSFPANWSDQVLAVSKYAFPGVARNQAERVIPIVDRHARRFDLDPLLVLAVIQVESRFDPAAVSSQGAMGLMQLQAETARELAANLGLQWTGDELLFDPDVNVLLGCAYLSRLIDRFGDVDSALAAYCSGPALVEARRDVRGRIPLAYTDRVWDVLTTLHAKASA